MHIPVLQGIPSGLGVDAATCVGLYNGETCTAGCVAPFEGGPVNLTCNPLSGQLEGPVLECKEKVCEVAQLPSNYSTADCAAWSQILRPAEATRVRTGRLFSAHENGMFDFCPDLADGTFAGTLPSCERTPCMPGETCEITCALGFEGSASTYSCDMAGGFTGTPPSCSPKRCDVPAEFFGSVRYNTSCDGVRHGQSCMTKCNQGYSGLPTQQRCFNGIFSGVPPSCSGNPCSFEGFQLGKGVNASTCFGLVTRETCTLSCLRGHTIEGNDLVLTCQASGEFTATDAVCVPAQCGDLTLVSPFSSPSVDDSCYDGNVNKQFGEVCFAFCAPGYSLDSNATLLMCEEAPESSAGFKEMAGAATHDAEMSSGPTCTPKPCVRGIPNMRGTSSDCLGKRTGEACTISADLGFDLFGSPSLQCQVDGSFTQDLPTVSPAVCPTPNYESSVGSTCDNKTVGADCWAYCNPGFEGRPKPYQCRVNETAAAVQIEQMEDTINCTNISLGTETNDTNDTNVTGGRRLQTLDPCGIASVAQVGLDGIAYFHDCTGKVHDGVCIAHCAQGWNMTEPEPSIFVCKSGFLVGALLPTCIPLPCSYAFPDALGVRHDCLGVRSAETCQATCTE
ncbi:SVEP1, partial [Symbiodinium sp. CCMP2456]